MDLFITAIRGLKVTLPGANSSSKRFDFKIMIDLPLDDVDETVNQESARFNILLTEARAERN